MWAGHPAPTTRVPEVGADSLYSSRSSCASSTRLADEVLRVGFPWHLGTRRLTTHRPMGVEAKQLVLRNRRRGSRMDLMRCCQPDGRDQMTHAQFGDQATDETRRAHAPRRNTPLRGRPHTVGVECFKLDIQHQSGEVRENRSPTISRVFSA